HRQVSPAGEQPKAHDAVGNTDVPLVEDDVSVRSNLREKLTDISRSATVIETASIIAHELNQPLAAIATYANACERLLGTPDPDIEEVRTALRQIADQAVRAGDIIRGLRGCAQFAATAAEIGRSELGGAAECRGVPREV